MIKWPIAVYMLSVSYKKEEGMTGEKKRIIQPLLSKLAERAKHTP